MVINKRNFYVFIIVFFLSVISGLRIFGFDRDYFNYLRYFIKTSFEDLSRFEPGFHLFTNLFKLIFGSESFPLFLFVLTFIALFLKFSILSRLRYFPLFVVIYFMLILPLHEMMQIRAALATGVIFYALFLSSSLELSFIKRILWALLGVSMHYSVIVLAPLVLFSEFFMKRSLFFMILVLVIPPSIILFSLEIIDIIFYFLPQNLPLNKLLFEFYLQMASDVNLFSSRAITLVTLFLIGAWNINYFPRHLLPWFYMSVIGIGLFFGLQSIPVFAHRFLEITVFSYLVWVPYLPKISRIIGISLLFVFSVYFLYRAFYISPFFAG
jgi:hypothetical protein